MLPQMTPYTPSLYQPDSRGRFRAYPRTTETPIPGAGYHVGDMYWGEQELNLRSAAEPQHYGSYSRVPLRGMGALLTERLYLPTYLPTGEKANEMRQAIARMMLAEQGGGAAPSSNVSPDDTQGYDPAADIARAVAEAEAARGTAPAPTTPEQDARAAEEEATPFLLRKAGPVPYWAIGALGLAVVAGGGYVAYRKFRK